MNRYAGLFITIFFLFITTQGIFAQRGGRSQETLEVRLASPLPRNSDWGRGLDRLAAEWARVTNNEVRLRVIHDGLEGGEAKMLSSLSADNIQAALFASPGISEICPAVMTLSVPFMIKNEAEFDLVLKEMLPVFEAQIQNTNFVVVSWSKGGWVNIFSKEQVVVPDDLRKQKLGTSPELKHINTALRTMGFQEVETETADMGIRLANNQINAIYNNPAVLAPLGLHRNLGNMLDLPIAPAMAAIVMNRVTWNKLGPDRQRDLMRVTQRVAADFDTAMPRTISSAVTAMQRDGLKVHKPNQAQEGLWHAEASKTMPMLLGTTFDRDIYQRINVILDRARGGR